MTASSSTFWNKLRDKVLAPKVSPEELEEHLKHLRDKLPIPVFWLFGKAQAGKTSLIRALTGSSDAEIGNGFRPCTRTSRIYSFPNEQECFLKFLDTRGLGEVQYDPTDDMRELEKQAHLLIVVVRAMDHAAQSMLTPLWSVMRAHPEWPVIVVQTALHDGYPPTNLQHELPYPFGTLPYPPNVPSDLARSLASQRAWFDGKPVHFVPVDFTLPGDGLEPQNYGLDELWNVIEQVLPLGLRGMLQQSLSASQPIQDMYRRTARPHIISYAVAAGAAAAVPVPMIDIPLVLALQAKMYHTIASIYNQPTSKQRMAEILGTLGVSYASRMAGRELLKVIPGVGSAVAALYTAASTYALGRTLCVYFSYALQGDLPDTQALRDLYQQEYEAGRQQLRNYLQKISRRPPEPKA
jgi:uncharacterized protein (DUF697 family)